jgi:hypothetical protein
MEEKRWYDEDQELSTLWSWVIIILFSASIAGFGWLVYLLVPDAPRQWDFGQLPDTPAEYIYSTDEPDLSKRPQRQILKLPEAQPLNPEPAKRK